MKPPKIPKQSKYRIIASNGWIEHLSMLFIENIVSKKYIHISLNILPIVIGLVLSLMGCCTAFQRSGSILVALVILNTFLIYIASSQKKGVDSFLKIYNNSLINRLGENGKTQFEATLVNAEKAQRNLYDIIKRLYFTEAVMGVGGTLIWGFGDLLFCP